MAESFHCGDDWVHLSNGATESLFESWERLALSDADQPGMVELAAYLRKSLDDDGAGCRTFGMNHESLPDELVNPNELAALLAVVEKTAANPMLITDVVWSDELVSWWRERLRRMVQSLRIAMESQRTYR